MIYVAHNRQHYVCERERKRKKEMRKQVVLVAVTTAVAVMGVAALIREWNRRSVRRWRQTQRILRKFARESGTPVPKLWSLANDMVSQMEAGLISHQTNLPMLPSYVSSLPTGDEKGLYYGVNLRGENFFMLRGRLGGKSEPISDLHKEEVSIPSNLMAATSKELFDYVALQLAKFVSLDTQSNNGAEATQSKLGFTVSFPVEQDTPPAGTAIQWKSFSTDDKVGKELVNEVNQALENHGVDMRVSALVDDAIGDLSGGRYYNIDSVAAVSLGMGTNAAYVEQAHSVHKWHGQSPKSGEMVIDMQWGGFSSSHLPITEFDACLDAESSNPGKQIFEKLISGMYLGEIVRRVLLKMAQETALFGNTIPPKLIIPYLLRSPDMAAMHQDASEDYEVVDEKLREVFGVTSSTLMVRKVVAEVCDIVAERGARLAGAGIVGIIKKLGRIANKKSIITIEGGLYEHYRIFRNYLHSSVWEMLGNELSDNVIIQHSHGGSGAGTVFLAASQTHHADS